MREIKFRGKVIDRPMCYKLGDWAIGDLFHFYDEGWIIQTPHDGTLEWSGIVDENTIGQFTGWKDMHGKEIYDGDILAVKFNNRYCERISWQGEPNAMGTVFWDFNSFRLKCAGKEDRRYADFYDFLDNREQVYNVLDMSLQNTEIIGNIHENEDLLK